MQFIGLHPYSQENSFEYRCKPCQIHWVQNWPTFEICLIVAMHLYLFVACKIQKSSPQNELKCWTIEDMKCQHIMVYQWPNWFRYVSRWFGNFHRHINRQACSRFWANLCFPGKIQTKEYLPYEVHCVPIMMLGNSGFSSFWTSFLNPASNWEFFHPACRKSSNFKIPLANPLYLLYLLLNDVEMICSKFERHVSSSDS